MDLGEDRWGAFSAHSFRGWRGWRGWAIGWMGRDGGWGVGMMVVGAGSAPLLCDRGARGLAEGIGGPAFGVLVDVVGDRAMGAIVPDDPFVVVALPDFYARGVAELIDLFRRVVLQLTDKLADRDRFLRNWIPRSLFYFEDKVDVIGHDNPTLDRDSRILKAECF